jgi:hypothetical protein
VLSDSPPNFTHLTAAVPILKNLRDTVVEAEYEGAHIAKDLNTQTLWSAIEILLQNVRQRRDIADETSILYLFYLLTLLNDSKSDEVFVRYMSIPVAGGFEAVSAYYLGKLGRAGDLELNLGDRDHGILAKDWYKITFNKNPKNKAMLMRHYQFNLDRELALQKNK